MGSLFCVERRYNRCSMRNVGLIVTVAAALSGGCKADDRWGLDLTIELVNLAVPGDVELWAAELDGTDLLSSRAQLVTGDVLFANGSSGNLIVVADPEATGIEVLITAYADDVGSTIVAEAGATYARPADGGFVSATLSLLRSSGDSAVSDAGDGGPDSATDSGSDAGSPQITPSQCPDPPAEIVTVTTLTDHVDDTLPTSEADVLANGISLREAIYLTSNIVGPWEIRFDGAVFPMGGSQTIMVGAPGNGVDGLPLPPIDAGNVCINGAGRNVTLDGTDVVGPASPGLDIASDFVIVVGLRIGDFAGDGVVIRDSTGSQIHNAVIGVLGAGNFGNDGNGVLITDVTSGTVVNNSSIGFNGAAGIALDGVAATNTTIIANLIGVTAGGTNSGNVDSGILLEAAMGSVAATEIIDNTIGFNMDHAIEIDGLNAAFTSITGNALGTDVTAMDDLANVKRRYSHRVRTGGHHRQRHCQQRRQRHPSWRNGQYGHDPIQLRRQSSGHRGIPLHGGRQRRRRSSGHHLGDRGRHFRHRRHQRKPSSCSSLSGRTPSARGRSFPPTERRRGPLPTPFLRHARRGFSARRR